MPAGDSGRFLPGFWIPAFAGLPSRKRGNDSGDADIDVVCDVRFPLTRE